MKRFSLPLPAPVARSTACIALASLVLAWLPGCSEHAPPPADATAGTTSAPAAPAGLAMARGRIEVQGGLLELSPLQDGVVETVAVHEGQSVARGQVLLRLASAGMQAELGVAQAELQLAEARQRARLQHLPALRRNAARLAEAASAGATEPQRAEDAAQSLRDAEADTAIARAEADVARQRLAQVRAQQARLELRAPEEGTVVRVSTQTGQRLLASAGGPSAVTLMPRRPLVVRAEINESYAAAVQPGMRASITTDGDAAPAALPAARVVRISPVLGTARLQDDVQRGPVRVVECVLEFDQAPDARPGQSVRVSFHP
ncbi:HlyD family secretion protein [Acidovorax sp. NCPPB 4044]|uniref:HlyD family secretion protein n=1 Tax=Acidovorax sp. NCPPB 4044 TaxID=2940490 RepID=UPI0023047D27|nr:HlyD family efflux transporter periplasmic adaptor subunit [Acidovorax sp. NCPPB 4044]MDA8519231.1 HlyD family efflux transporter periplasmic adaptor subunit [Acidovorax sp. NCPPB 4044]